MISLPDGQKHSSLFDGLGSIVAMTGSSGNEVNSYDYDPYGQNINQVEQTGLNTPWKFAGGSLDSSTTLYTFGTRYYDSTLGRWTQQDPVGRSLGDLNSANRYMYANDDPVNAVDPSGRYSISPIWGFWFIPIGIQVSLSQGEAQEVASGTGWVIALAILALIPAPFSIPVDLIIAGVTAYEPFCGTQGVIVFIYFTGDPGFQCG